MELSFYKAHNNELISLASSTLGIKNKVGSWKGKFQELYGSGNNIFIASRIEDIMCAKYCLSYFAFALLL